MRLEVILTVAALLAAAYALYRLGQRPADPRTFYAHAAGAVPRPIDPAYVGGEGNAGE